MIPRQWLICRQYPSDSWRGRGYSDSVISILVAYLGLAVAVADGCRRIGSALSTAEKRLCEQIAGVTFVLKSCKSS